MDILTQAELQRRIRCASWIDGSLDRVADELQDLWLAAGEDYDAGAQEVVGQLLDESTERLAEREAAFAESMAR